MTWTAPALAGWMFILFAAAWLPPKKWQGWAISATGLLFMAAAAPFSLALLSALGLCSYFLPRYARKQVAITAALSLAVISLIIWFKAGVRLDDDTARKIVPIGLAFYGLRIIHYLFDAGMKQLPAHTFSEYCRYLLFFPTMVAGPINRFKGFHRDDRRRRWDASLAAAGFERILFGYFKIIVLANHLVGVEFTHWLATTDIRQDWLLAYLDCLKYGMNLYFQFSGYSDIAIGLALLIGFRIEENFNWPFLALNINDFWQRWHMTLSSWCRDYIFLPVSSLTRNPYSGVVASMLVLGLWHEISPRYCLWGLYHGMGIMVWQLFQKVRGRLDFLCNNGIFSLISWALTFNFVILGFAITNEPSVEKAMQTLQTILTFGR